METKLGRPQRLADDDIKKPRTVSLTNKEAEAIRAKHGSLTTALLMLFKKIR